MIEFYVSKGKILCHPFLYTRVQKGNILICKENFILPIVLNCTVLFSNLFFTQVDHVKLRLHFQVKM